MCFVFLSWQYNLLKKVESSLYSCFGKISIAGTWEWRLLQRISFSYSGSLISESLQLRKCMKELTKACSYEDNEFPYQWIFSPFFRALSLERQPNRQAIMGKSKGPILNSILWAHNRPPVDGSKHTLSAQDSFRYFLILKAMTKKVFLESELVTCNGISPTCTLWSCDV